MRTVYSVAVDVQPRFGVPCVCVDVCGSGFLYNMVRIMAGAVLGVGDGSLPLSRVERALETGNRDLLGKTMPANGLTLLSVDYGFAPFGESGQ